jgi:hypothetical protein
MLQVSSYYTLLISSTSPRSKYDMIDYRHEADIGAIYVLTDSNDSSHLAPYDRSTFRPYLLKCPL